LPVKQKYVVGEPVKKVNLSKITPHNIKKDSIWVSLDEKNCQNKALFATLKENFATKAAPCMYLSILCTSMTKSIYFSQLKIRVATMTPNLHLQHQVLATNPPQYFVFSIHVPVKILVRSFIFFHRFSLYKILRFDYFQLSCSAN